MRGTTLVNGLYGIPAGPRLTCLRAFTDNDRWMYQGGTWHVDHSRSVMGSGLSQIRYHPEKTVVAGNVVKTRVHVDGAKGACFLHECDWTFGADGSLVLVNKVTPYGRMPEALPRLGFTMYLLPSFANMSWYGRGPGENYVDRKASSFFGLWKSTVAEQYTPYVRPQDCGMKLRRPLGQFTDGNGRGVRFSADVPLFLQALNYTWEDLLKSRHQNGEVRTPRSARSARRGHPQPRRPPDRTRRRELRPAFPMDKYRLQSQCPVFMTLKIEKDRKMNLLLASALLGAMMTTFGEKVTPENAWREYPRPQMVRANWANLNGQWDYAITSVTNTPGRPVKWDGKILVPFALESALSGVGRLLEPNEFLWYTRKIVCTKRPGERILLNFDGVDFRAMVFIGHREVDLPHSGAHEPFTLDITDYVRDGENELTLCVWDPTQDYVNSRGKQSLRPSGCHYTRMSASGRRCDGNRAGTLHQGLPRVQTSTRERPFEFDKVGEGEVR